MLTSPTPRQILATLLPYLKTAGIYAQQIQSRIAAQPEKESPAGNIFSAALSDADLSIQTMIEVVLLGTFPEIRFFGEEYAQSYNTKYFRATDLGPMGDYLVTLDPIDGTKFYLDGHNNYQVILTVLNRDEFEAAIALTPGQRRYYYTLRGQGTFQGTWEDDLETCRPVNIPQPTPAICLGWAMGDLVDRLSDRYTVYHTKTHYSPDHPIPNFNGLLSGDLTGAVLASSQFIDGAALAFMAQEMGYVVTTLEGDPPPPLHTCRDYRRPGLLVASTPVVHQDLLAAVQASQ